MGEQQRFGWAVALSFLAHVELWWWLSPESDNDRPPVRLDVVLVPAEPLLPEDQHPPQVSPDPEPEEDRIADVQQPPDQSEPHQPPETTATRLNLEKPENWDELVRSLPGPGTTLAFNPGLSEALGRLKSVRRLEAFEVRLALLEERRHAFLEIFRGEER